MSDSDSKKSPDKSINVPIELYTVEGINVIHYFFFGVGTNITKDENMYCKRNNRIVLYMKNKIKDYFTKEL